MATIKKFEDLEIWQIARTLCQLVDRLTEKASNIKHLTSNEE